jgi:hypothetical protein
MDKMDRTRLVQTRGDNARRTLSLKNWIPNLHIHVVQVRLRWRPTRRERDLTNKGWSYNGVGELFQGRYPGFFIAKRQRRRGSKTGEGENEYRDVLLIRDSS